MAVLRWNSSFDIGIDVIDKQHRFLMGIINDLYYVMMDGNSRDELKKLIRKLGVYASIHFAREEHFFKVFGYPHAETHKEEHNDFEDKIHGFENKFIRGEQELTLNILLFLSDWLVDHIKGSDQKYGPYLRERGLQ